MSAMLGRERAIDTQYQFEDHSPTIPTYRKREERKRQ